MIAICFRHSYNREWDVLKDLLDFVNINFKSMAEIRAFSQYLLGSIGMTHRFHRTFRACLVQCLGQMREFSWQEDAPCGRLPVCHWTALYDIAAHSHLSACTVKAGKCNINNNGCPGAQTKGFQCFVLPIRHKHMPFLTYYPPSFHKRRKMWTLQ